MRIDEVTCTGCGECIPYCPVFATKEVAGTVAIDFDGCVECGSCLRYAPCPVDAIQESPETDRWPRLLRREFSNPGAQHSTTKGYGRGTEESKTNDVTGRVKRGQVGMAMEFGRPGISTALGELEKMTTAMATAGVHFEEKNPVTFLLAGPTTGRMKDDVRNERVLSAILEVEFPVEKIPVMVPLAEKVAETLDTVFSFGMFMRIEDDGSIPALDVLKGLGVQIRPNAKVNMGLGKPRAQD